MAELSKNFISANDMSEMIDNALRITGEFMGVTRIVIVIAEKDFSESHAVFMWPSVNEIVTAPSRELVSVMNIFPKEQPEDGLIPAIYCNNIHDDERYTVMETAGVKSFIMGPLYVDGKIWAVIIIEECLRTRIWTESERQLVSAVSSLISGTAIRVQRERERNAALVQAKQASQAKTDFLTNMSHEMRTPMNAIIGMTAIAKTSKDPEKKEYCLGKIEDASTHLLGVINDILDMSKIEANKFELSFDDFNFEKMLRKVVNVINFRVEEKRQNFFVRIDKNIPANLYGDDLRLAQVISNLLANAVKFTPEEGNIRLDTEFEKEEDGFCVIRISVSDSGIGISREQQIRLFSSFQQADSSTSRKFGGTGLGLAISKRIVEMMNGRIWVESELGKGASFTFTVKLEKGRQKQEPLLAPGVRWDNLYILVVDDDRDIRVYFSDLAEQLRFFCDTAASGEEAFSLIEKNGPYDMYFVDWKMPGIDGIEFTRGLKKNAQTKSVVIMISAAEWSVIETEAKKAGVDKFLSKPLFPSIITDCIAECIGSADRVLPTPPEGEALPAEDLSGFRILLAEDVDINREIVYTILEPTALGIDSVENGALALKMYTEDPDKYDLILMDIQMPEMDGYEATREIRLWEKEKERRPVPIVAMTANVFKEDIEKCLAAGMDGHVGKPLDFGEVLDKLRKFLHR
jgi:signal transduction histidine kinase/DNA-binding response OmpR family regulator